MFGLATGTAKPLLSSPIVSEMSNVGVGKHKRDQRKSNNKSRVWVLNKHSLKDEDIEDIAPAFNEDESVKFRASLLEWYDLNHRDLPWRRLSHIDKEDNSLELQTRAYAVWVSEIMLQQTRVQTVIDYYNRWMEKWPTIHHLARASLEEVNEVWAGLGYYRRARFLLEGAKKLVTDGGIIPEDVSALRKISGVGEYTAGAIASIAFQKVVPVVDGNVVRVTARLKAMSANPKDKATVKEFWKLATELVDPLRPGDFNQALMELGATICTPLNPSCSSCPVSEHCKAHLLSKSDNTTLVTDYPVKSLKTKQRSDFSAVCVVEILGAQNLSEGNPSRSMFLLIKRPDEGLLAGLWEFPSVLLEGECNLAARRGAINHYMQKIIKLSTRKICNIVLREEVGEFIHIFSHIRLKVYIELLVLNIKGGIDDLFKKQLDEPITWKCVESNALQSMGLTSSVRKVYTMVQKFKQKDTHYTTSPAKKRNRT